MVIPFSQKQCGKFSSIKELDIIFFKELRWQIRNCLRWLEYKVCLKLTHELYIETANEPQNM